MSSDLPEYYFRTRDRGALVFRLSDDSRNRRIDMDPIAQINLRRGTVKPQGDRALSEADHEAIRDWIKDRQDLMAARSLDDVMRSVDQMNQTAHWAQTQASDMELEAVTDSLLMAMHDLRNVLIRKKADRLSNTD